jgi:hypothetical protein
MPLVPATMLFVDPSYDSRLANPPNEKSALIDTSGATDLPKTRGAAGLFLWTDRARFNRGGSILFMADIRFERPPEPLAVLGPDGDVVPPDGTCQPADGACALAACQPLRWAAKAREPTVRKETTRGRPYTKGKCSHRVPKATRVYQFLGNPQATAFRSATCGHYQQEHYREGLTRYPWQGPNSLRLQDPSWS